MGTRSSRPRSSSDGSDASDKSDASSSLPQTPQCAAAWHHSYIKGLLVLQFSCLIPSVVAAFSPELKETPAQVGQALNKSFSILVFLVVLMARPTSPHKKLEYFSTACLFAGVVLDTVFSVRNQIATDIDRQRDAERYFFDNEDSQASLPFPKKECTGFNETWDLDPSSARLDPNCSCIGTPALLDQFSCPRDTHAKNASLHNDVLQYVGTAATLVVLIKITRHLFNRRFKAQTFFTAPDLEKYVTNTIPILLLSAFMSWGFLFSENVGCLLRRKQDNVECWNVVSSNNAFFDLFLLLFYLQTYVIPFQGLATVTPRSFIVNLVQFDFVFNLQMQILGTFVVGFCALFLFATRDEYPEDHETDKKTGNWNALQPLPRPSEANLTMLQFTSYLSYVVYGLSLFVVAMSFFRPVDAEVNSKIGRVQRYVSKLMKSDYERDHAGNRLSVDGSRLQHQRTTEHLEMGRSPSTIRVTGDDFCLEFARIYRLLLACVLFGLFCFGPASSIYWIFAPKSEHRLMMAAKTRVYAWTSFPLIFVLSVSLFFARPRRVNTLDDVALAIPPVALLLMSVTACLQEPQDLWAGGLALFSAVFMSLMTKVARRCRTLIKLQDDEALRQHLCSIFAAFFTVASTMVFLWAENVGCVAAYNNPSLGLDKIDEVNCELMQEKEVRNFLRYNLTYIEEVVQVSRKDWDWDTFEREINDSKFVDDVRLTSLENMTSNSVPPNLPVRSIRHNPCKFTECEGMEAPNQVILMHLSMNYVYLVLFGHLMQNWSWDDVLGLKEKTLKLTFLVQVVAVTLSFCCSFIAFGFRSDDNTEMTEHARVLLIVVVTAWSVSMLAQGMEARSQAILAETHIREGIAAMKRLVGPGPTPESFEDLDDFQDVFGIEVIENQATVLGSTKKSISFKTETASDDGSTRSTKKSISFKSETDSDDGSTRSTKKSPSFKTETDEESGKNPLRRAASPRSSKAFKSAVRKTMQQSGVETSKKVLTRIEKRGLRGGRLGRNSTMNLPATEHQGLQMHDRVHNLLTRVDDWIWGKLNMAAELRSEKKEFAKLMTVPIVMLSFLNLPALIYAVTTKSIWWFWVHDCLRYFCNLFAVSTVFLNYNRRTRWSVAFDMFMLGSCAVNYFIQAITVALADDDFGASYVGAGFSQGRTWSVLRELFYGVVVLFVGAFLYKCKACIRDGIHWISREAKARHGIEVVFVRALVGGANTLLFLTSSSIACLYKAWYVDGGKRGESLASDSVYYNEQCGSLISGNKAMVFEVLAVLTYQMALAPLENAVDGKYTVAQMVTLIDVPRSKIRSMLQSPVLIATSCGIALWLFGSRAEGEPTTQLQTGLFTAIQFLWSVVFIREWKQKRWRRLEMDAFRKQEFGGRGERNRKSLAINADGSGKDEVGEGEIELGDLSVGLDFTEGTTAEVLEEARGAVRVVEKGENALKDNGQKGALTEMTEMSAFMY